MDADKGLDNSLSVEEKAKVNATKDKNKVSATLFLHSNKQCVSRLKWDDSWKAGFDILVSCFPKGDPLDFPAISLLWRNVSKADGWFEGVQHDLNPCDCVALKNYNDPQNKKQSQHATPVEAQVLTQATFEPTPQPPAPPNPTPPPPKRPH